MSDYDRYRSQTKLLPRLRAGRIGAQFFSVFVPTIGSDGEPLQASTSIALTLEQIDCVHQMCELYPDVFELVGTASNIHRIFREGKIASMCGIEGGHQIGGSLRTLRIFHKLGARYMILTHNGGPGWADPAVNPDGSWCKDPKVGGLNEFGRSVVMEMNRMGMIVDLSHVHAVTMHAALDTPQAPVIFSHSSTRALCAHPRDVPDDVLERRTRKRGRYHDLFSLSFRGWRILGRRWKSRCDDCGGRRSHRSRGPKSGDRPRRNRQRFRWGCPVCPGPRGRFEVSFSDLRTPQERLYRNDALEAAGGGNVIRVLHECERIGADLKNRIPAGEDRWGPEFYETNAMKEARPLGEGKDSN